MRDSMLTGYAYQSLTKQFSVELKSMGWSVSDLVIWILAEVRVQSH